MFAGVRSAFHNNDFECISMIRQQCFDKIKSMQCLENDEVLQMFLNGDLVEDRQATMFLPSSAVADGDQFVALR